MVLIAERAIICIICVMIVFNKAKYHICDNNEFASYLLRLTTNAYARAYCFVNLFNFFLIFTYFSTHSNRSVALAWAAVAQLDCNICIPILNLRLPPHTLHVAQYLTCVQ